MKNCRPQNGDVLQRMVRALVYADLHATEGSERCYADPSMPLQRFRVKAFFEFLHKTYVEHQCTAVWDLGDTTDDRNAIPIPTIEVCGDGLRWKPRSEFDILAIGNHQQFVKNTVLHGGSLFSRHFEVVDKVRIFQVEGVVVIVTAFPEKEHELAAELEVTLTRYRNSPKIILGHVDVAGSRTKGGMLLSGLDVALLDKADLTLLGHIHMPQRLGNNVFYVGSPFQQNFGEAGEAKRVGIVTIDGSEFTLEWVAVPGFPEYRTVDLAEFKRACNQDSEDRFEVVLRTLAETEEFYALPLSGRARPVYAFNNDSEVPLSQSYEPKDWSLGGALKEYMKQVDPATKGISLPAEELLKFGEEIAV